jgi:hypothetical protein
MRKDMSCGQARIGWRAAALLTAAALGLQGCYSALPQALTYPMTTQHHMQAVQHWQMLAEDVADQLAEHKVWKKGMPVYVDGGPDPSPFNQAFTTFLEKELLGRGAMVSEQAEGALLIHYTTQVVPFASDRAQLKPGTFTLIGAGIAVSRLDGIGDPAFMAAAAAGGILADVLAGYVTSVTDTDLLFSVSIYDGALLQYRSTSVYYIDDADGRQYETMTALALAPGVLASDVTEDSFRYAELACAEQHRIAVPRSEQHDGPTRIYFECVDR